MGARRIPRPQTGIPASPDDVLKWLEFLTLSSDSRGLAGYELAECTELLAMNFLGRFSGEVSCEGRARTLRSVLVVILNDESAASGPDKATLMLLGLTPSTTKQPRSVRRQRAANTLELVLDTFQKTYERKLLRDVAHEIWRLEIEVSRTA